MTTWRSFHIHYSQLDRLILDCVAPFLERHSGDLERRFWERHYAGGRNLRVRLGGSAESLQRIGDALVQEVEAYLAANPSPDLESYSEEQASALLAREGLDPEQEDLVYRNNVIVEGQYPIHRHVFKSEEAATLVDDFRHDSVDFVTAVLRDTAPRWRTVLQLYFVHSIASVDQVKAGSVSWKSHWEGFAAGFPSVEVVERIQQDYQNRHAEILGVLEETLELQESGELEQHPLYGPWLRLVRSYRERANRELAEGIEYTFQPNTDEEARETGRQAIDQLRRDSEFLRLLWSSERFLTAIQHEPRFQVPRVLVNLFYNVLPLLGVRPIEKMVFCHHVHRAVEDHYECDLLDVFRGTMHWMEQRETARRSVAQS